MNAQLKQDLDKFGEILHHTINVVQHHFDRSETLPPGRFIPDIPMESLPHQGVGANAVLDYFENNFADKLANSTGPRYFGFVTGGSTPASVAAIGLSVLTIKMLVVATTLSRRRSSGRPFISLKNFLD